MKKLSKLPNVATFTVKHDFNMTGFQLAARPDEMFECVRLGKDQFSRTHTRSNIKTKKDFSEDEVVDLISAGRKVLIYYQLEKKLDAYNYDEMKLLDLVVKY